MILKPLFKIWIFWVSRQIASQEIAVDFVTSITAGFMIPLAVCPKLGNVSVDLFTAYITVLPISRLTFPTKMLSFSIKIWINLNLHSINLCTRLIVHFHQVFQFCLKMIKAFMISPVIPVYMHSINLINCPKLDPN